MSATHFRAYLWKLNSTLLRVLLAFIFFPLSMLFYILHELMFSSQYVDVFPPCRRRRCSCYAPDEGSDQAMPGGSLVQTPTHRLKTD